MRIKNADQIKVGQIYKDPITDLTFKVVSERYESRIEERWNVVSMELIKAGKTPREIGWSYINFASCELLMEVV